MIWLFEKLTHSRKKSKKETNKKIYNYLPQEQNDCIFSKDKISLEQKQSLWACAEITGYLLRE